MSTFDVSQFKLALAAARDRDRDEAKLSPGAGVPGHSQSLKNRRAIEQLIKPALAKAGLDIIKLNELLAQNQSERRKLFQAEKAAAAHSAAAQRNAFHQSVDEGAKAIQYLANPPANAGWGLSSLVALTTPFLIWEWPLDVALVGTHIEPLRSRARIKLDVPAYAFDNDSGSGRREFSFFFFWTNASPFLAVVKCFSVLGLNGACELYANAGITSGDKMSLSIDAYLYPVSYWLPLPPGGDIRSLRMQGDPLQHQSVLNNLTAEGGVIFGDPGTQTRQFSAVSAGMSYQSFGGLQIPAGKTALFEVNLTLSYSWDGNTLPDEIIADFADDHLQYSVECPLVVLQFLTQPPAMA
jgi:hypothetical protein